MAYKPNTFHTILLASYPDVDMLPIDPEQPADVNDRVAADKVGDSLFQFLWRELADVAAEDRDEALKRIGNAASQLKAVHEALLKDA